MRLNCIILGTLDREAMKQSDFCVLRSLKCSDDKNSQEMWVLNGIYEK